MARVYPRWDPKGKPMGNIRNLEFLPDFPALICIQGKTGSAFFLPCVCFMLKIDKTDSLYPQGLLRLKNSPQSIYLEGTPQILSGNYISIVGSRNLSYGLKQWMEHEILPTLQLLNIGVISGGARGVDQWAHFLALRAGQPTLVVLPSGLKKKYPQSIERLTQNPLVVFLSEYEADLEMKKYYFYDRNRLIAALSEQTLIIQASEKSGTMITAQAAIELGNNLLVLPGNPGDSTMAGNNQLLFDGAQMIRNRRDLIAILKNDFHGPAPAHLS